MRASVQDTAALKAVDPAVLSSYLKSAGWARVDVIRGGLGAIWTKLVADETAEILQPLSTELRDYSSRISDALRLLAQVEERDQLSVLRDLHRSGIDLLRLRVIRTDAADGTLPLESAVKAINHARELVMAAACMAVEKKVYFPTRKPTKATDYLRKARLGQTEHGSFVLTIESTVPPSLTEAQSVEEPFERTVMTTLARSLVAAKAAAQRAAAGEGITPFHQALESGVNSNLCEAVAGLLDDSNGDLSLQVSFSWSLLRPSPVGVPSSVALTRDLVPILAEAARVLREAAPRDLFPVMGPVLRLSRKSPDEPGRVTILSFLDGEPRRIVVEMVGADYATAIEAHGAGTCLRCVGRLEKQGTTWTLVNPQDVRPDQSDPADAPDA